MTTTSKKTLAISLAIALGVAILPLTGYAANSGGFLDSNNTTTKRLQAIQQRQMLKSA